MGTAEQAAVGRAPEVVPFLRALVLARNNLQLYPGANAIVQASLQDACAHLEGLTADGPLITDIRRDAIRVFGVVVPDLDGRFQRLAEEWYRRAVGRITWHKGLHVEELRALLYTLNQPVETLLLTGGPAAQPAVAEARHLVIEHGEGVTISGADAARPDSDQVLADIEQCIASEALDQADGFQRFFLRVGEGDVERVQKLQRLLEAPEHLSLLFANFALRVRERAGDDDGLALTQLLQIIEAADDIVRDLPSESARHKMCRGLAQMISGLGEEARDALVVDGLVPRVPVRGLEARILRLFPVHELATALSRHVVVHEGTAAMLADCFSGLELDAPQTEMLGLLVMAQLEEAGALTPDLEQFFGDVLVSSLPESANAPVSGQERTFIALPTDCHIDSAQILWQGREYRKARQEARREALKSEDVAMLPLLCELLRLESSPGDFASLAGHTRQLLMNFLNKGQYVQATDLLRLLQQERARRGDAFDADTLQRLDAILASLTEGSIVNRLLRALDAVDGDSLEARRILEYFRQLGAPLIAHLLDRLDAEQSRHMRLVLCHTIAKLAGGQGVLLAERVERREWYVARNMMTVAAELPPPEALALARRGVMHPEARVVREALKVLAQIRTPEGVRAMLPALDAPTPDVQLAAASWLGIVGAPEAVAPLARLLQPDAYAVDRGLALGVIEALGRIGTPEARRVLEPLAQTGSWLGRRRRAAIRDAARAALDMPSGAA